MNVNALRTRSGTIFLLIAVMVSCAAVIVVRHKNRIAFYQLQVQQEARNDLQAEWGRLMLERATWTVEHSIAEDSSKRLGMAPPAPDDIVTVQLGGKR